MTSASQIVAKGLQKLIKPTKIPLMKKDIKIQVQEINGLVEFKKGAYHNQDYEDLIFFLKDSRQKYQQETNILIKKQIATQQYEQWKQYIQKRQLQLPEEYIISDKMKFQMSEIWDLVKSRKIPTLQPKQILDFHFQYSKNFKFDINLDKKSLFQLIHPHGGYLLNFPKNLNLQELLDIYNYNLVASYERTMGQELLADEIASFSYWQNFDTNNLGYMSIDKFSDYVKIFRINIEKNFSNFQQQFEVALKVNKNEFDDKLNDEQKQEQIVRFDFYRYIFLERNL